jgi:hypothetical protein
MSTGKTALSAVQTAVMALLAADSALMLRVPGGVWDYVPEEPVWPYLCLESAEEVGADTMGESAGSQGRIVTLVFTVFSNYQGRAEQFAVIDALVRLLRETRFAIAGWERLAVWYDGARATSPFEVGNVRAGQSSATFRVHVLEARP